MGERMDSLGNTIKDITASLVVLGSTYGARLGCGNLTPPVIPGDYKLPLSASFRDFDFLEPPVKH